MFAKGDKTGGGFGRQEGEARAAPKKSGVPSIISSDLKVIGDLESAGEIQVEGAIEGNIHSESLIVNQGAHVKGSIRADTARIAGSVDGQVEAGSVIVGETAKVRGDIIHKTLQIDAGAFVEGNCRRLEASPPPRAAATPEAAAAEPRGGNGGGATAGGAAGQSGNAGAKPAAR